MSIINAFISPNLALVGADSDAVSQSGEHFETSKLHVLTHLNAVVAFRGYVGSVMYSLPGLIGFSGSFDDLAEAMPLVLNTAQQTADLALEMSGNTTPSDFGDVQVVLVGYSPKHQRMVGHNYESRNGSWKFDAHSDVVNIVSPGLEVLPDIVADREGMMVLAKVQCEWIRKMHPGKSAGGRFFVATLQKGEMRVEETVSL